MTNAPRLDERAAELRAVRERLRALEAALDWAADEDAVFVSAIRERAKTFGVRPC